MHHSALLSLAICTFLVANSADAAPVLEDTLGEALGSLQERGDALGEAMQIMAMLAAPVDPNASKEQLQAREKVVKGKLKELANNPAFKESGEDPATMDMKTLSKKEKDIKEKIKEVQQKKKKEGDAPPSAAAADAKEDKEEAQKAAEEAKKTEKAAEVKEAKADKKAEKAKEKLVEKKDKIKKKLL